MSLFEKIQAIYPEDDDVVGWYIEAWNHPTLAQPTQEQLDAVGEE